jgi:hypothetical protein
MVLGWRLSLMKTFNVHSPAGEVEESPAERYA